jgi:hypothetical protein
MEGDLCVYTRISVPTEIAEELIDAKVAVRPITTRGGSTAGVFSMTVDCINTGSAVVSIAVAVATCKRLAAAAIKRRHPADPNIVTFQVTMAGKSESLTVDRTSPTAQDRTLDFFVRALDA